METHHVEAADKTDILLFFIGPPLGEGNRNKLKALDVRTSLTEEREKASGGVLHRASQQDELLDGRRPFQK
jgi:hypothetical protein